MARRRTAKRTSGTEGKPFELRINRERDNEIALEVWQQSLNGDGAELTEPVKVARVRGTALHAIWDHLLLLLRPAGIGRDRLSPAQRERRASLPEPVGVRVALLAAAAAPLRKLERIERVAAAIDNMSYDEACYWYAHTRSEHGRRALRALRLLLAPE